MIPGLIMIFSFYLRNLPYGTAYHEESYYCPGPISALSGIKGPTGMYS